MKLTCSEGIITIANLHSIEIVKKDLKNAAKSAIFGLLFGLKQPYLGQKQAISDINSPSNHRHPDF
jgi:hypothetical protein